MTAATYRLPTTIEFYVVPAPRDLSEEGRSLLEAMLRETPNAARTPAGETLFSRAVFDLHAWNMEWDPESLHDVLNTHYEARSVVVPVQF